MNIKQIQVSISITFRQAKLFFAVNILKKKKIINVMSQGRLFEDKVENFKKILLNNQRQKKLKITRCGKCGK